jgi:hypothetical protein
MAGPSGIEGLEELSNSEAYKVGTGIAESSRGALSS